MTDDYLDCDDSCKCYHVCNGKESNDKPLTPAVITIITIIITILIILLIIIIIIAGLGESPGNIPGALQFERHQAS